MGDTMKKYIKGIVFVLALAGFIVLPRVFKHKEQQIIVESIKIPDLILIELYGEVHMPGLYEVKKGTTYQELFTYALGLTAYADTSLFSLNDNINNSTKITVYKKTSEVVILLNINKATKEQLMDLPSIGQVTADKIIAYRETNGAFVSIEDIKKVSGIGEATFEKFKALITV